MSVPVRWFSLSSSALFPSCGWSRNVPVGPRVPVGARIDGADARVGQSRRGGVGVEPLLVKIEQPVQCTRHVLAHVGAEHGPGLARRGPGKHERTKKAGGGKKSHVVHEGLPNN